jgi:DNA (cytosine-5)-methyltransferase 1
MKYFSLFSGIGGFEVGIQKAIPYAKCVGFSEVDPYAKSIYKKHYPKHKDYGDITKINENKLPEFDCLVGGFPCQPFSISGKRGGFEDRRGTLFFDIERVLRAKQPKMFVLENVKGLLSHDSGRTFGVIIGALDELRYDVQWQVLNCKHHGTPQDRNRVFIVGYSRTCGESFKKILPIRYSSEKVIRASKQQAITNTIIKKHADGTRAGSYIVESGKKKVEQLDQINKKSNSGTQPQPYQQDRFYNAKGLSPTLSSTIEPKIKCLTPNTSRSNRIYNPNGISPCLIAKGGGLGAKTGLFATQQDTNNFAIRRLMPIECERLQDFDDDWTKYGKDGELISDNQRYSCIGNAVNTKVIKVLFDKIRCNLTTKKEEEKILIPRVVSFSGGRTSGMMLLQALKNNELHQWRGDVVIFNNTSAEHKATYDFVGRMKKICEEEYGIPFFILEFQTYEAKTSRGWVRRKTYRLVNSMPFCAISNINGYKFNGEIFEEVLSQTGVLPSPYQRNCTINMKILVTNLFLKDWFSGEYFIEQQGVESIVPNITEQDIINKHRKYKGELGDEVIVAKKSFARNSKTFRSKQLFNDFTIANINFENSYLSGKDKISLFGKDAITYMNYIGIRHDEKHRAIKIRQRIKDAKANLKLKGKNKKGGTVKTQPPFEVAYMPMIKARMTKEKVIEFWRQRENKTLDLVLPYNGLFSNCVHCFLKGKSKNQKIAQHLKKNDGTPNSLRWWSNIEEKYSRKVIKSTKNNYTNIGFFGASEDYVYQTWLDELNSGNVDVDKLNKNLEKESYNADCNCTD